MSFNDVLSNDTFITSVVFNEEALELTFLENRDQTEEVMEAKTLVFALGGDREKADILALVQDLLRDLIDRVYAERRAARAAYEQTERTPTSREVIQQRMAERRAEAPVPEGQELLAAVPEPDGEELLGE